MTKTLNRRSQVMLYTLLTEWKDNIPELAQNFVDGATVTRGLGIWHATREQSARIEVIGGIETADSVAALATAIRNVNNQQSVYVTEQPLTLTEYYSHD